MATDFARVPGAFFSPWARPASPSVTATIAVGLSTPAVAAVFTTIVWPETSVPGAWPVWRVVTPKPRTHSTSRSREL